MRSDAMAVQSSSQVRGGWRASRRRRDRIVKGFAYTVCTLIGLTYIFPFYWMAITALKTDQQIFQWPPALVPLTPQWQNFVESTRYIPFWLYMKNTVIICLIAMLGTIVSCTLVAYGFSRIRWPGREIAFLLYLSTIMLPGQVTMIPLYIIFRKLGWVGTIAPLVVPTFFGNAFFVFLLRQFLMTIPLELTDAARIDGASEMGTLWHIILPLIKPALTTVALFTFLANYVDFLRPLIYLTEQAQWTISLGLQMFKNMYGAQWQLMMAASTLTMIPTVVLFFFTQRTFIEGITMTGIKS
jgi:multiple sugar transport system permease protein